ncbi:MAG: hypothetical protein AABM29_11615 [Actinomycetota bacterium]
MSRFRLLFAIAAITALATGLVACGGGGGGSDEDPQKVLDATFSGDHAKVDSGNLDISLDVNVEGDQGGSLSASVSGPFQSEGENKIPSLDLAAKIDASGQGQDFNFEGGLITTPDSAFINYNGTDYEIDKSLFDQFKTAIESAAQQNQQNQQSGAEILKQLGIDDPQALLTNLSNDGEQDVEGTNTIHISGDLDVDKTVDAFKTLLSNASALGGLGGVDTSQLPSDAELDQVKQAIKEAHFDVYTGVDDDILRRFTVALVLEPPAGSGTGTINVDFDVTLGGVNEDQTIEAPSNAKPLSDLLQQFGIDPSALGALGSLGGIGGTGGTGGSGGSLPALPGGTPSGGDPQQYLDCVSQAQDAADLEACAAP